MKFSVGQKIRFIDSVGGGVITKIISEQKVVIEDEDGFDYEVATKDIMSVNNGISELGKYEASLPSESEIFNKDVDEEQLKKAQDKFSDLYKERVTIKNPEVMEVDLHIHQLLDSTQGMDNGAMLEYQIKHFERMMKIAERKRFPKVVFIHGVGEGVLRGEIRRIIEQFYPNCSFRDGNYREYGQGATQILIRYN